MSIYWIIFLVVVFILVSNDKAPMDLIEEEIQKIKIMQVRVNHRLKKGVSSEKQDYRLSLLEVLSKIAKVRLSNNEYVSAVLDNRLAVLRKSLDQENNASIELAERISLYDKLKFLALPHNDYQNIFGNVSNNEFKREQFHCQAILAVYVPDIKQKLPSYECESRGKTFVLVSKIFSEDRRNSFYVNVDCNTLRKLYNPTRSIKNRVKIVSPNLTLKYRQESYDLYNS